MSTASDWPLPDGSLIEQPDPSHRLRYQWEGGPIVRLNYEYMAERRIICHTLAGVILCGPVGLRILKHSPKERYYLCRKSRFWSAVAAFSYTARLRLTGFIVKAGLLDGYALQYQLIRWDRTALKFTPGWWARKIREWQHRLARLYRNRRYHWHDWKCRPGQFGGDIACRLLHPSLWVTDGQPWQQYLPPGQGRIGPQGWQTYYHVYICRCPKCGRTWHIQESEATTEART